ncbi:histone-like nucleoid-structuring protein Lsr2 [Mycolicibacterium llatzerense]|uniref:histone-like nucleoid-structuring protein Lsr2 n=1 Tax=Mycolicibacterium llatzerense TaxID=280871 RepID=UPI0008DDFD71|nr:Lsr2 family protein [Mycolicibacterium llatzerense]
MPAFITTDYVDDIDGVSIDPKNVDTVQFSHRGVEYTLVMAKENGAQFDTHMAPYIKAAKKAQAQLARAASGKTGTAARKSTATGKADKAPAKAAAPRKSAPARKTSAPRKTASPRRVASRNVDAVVDSQSRAKAIREWAAANGHTVSARGRISASVVEAFDAAN